MSIARIFIPDVETVGPHKPVAEVARQMRDRMVGTVVVVDDERRPMGIVSDRDVTVRLVAAGRDPTRTPVRDIMTPMPTTVLRDASIESTLSSMREGHMRRLPVVDGLGKLIGIVTLDDALRFLAEELKAVEQLLDEERPMQARAHERR
jgi:CBS domain-containing protein